MSDEIDDLKHLMDRATPAPDPGVKAAHLALARENFARHQESAAPARPTSDRPASGLIRGVKSMFAHLSTRGALTATTAIVAVALVVALPQLTEQPLPDLTVGLTNGKTAQPPEFRSNIDETRQRQDADQLAGRETVTQSEQDRRTEAEPSVAVPAPPAAPKPAPVVAGRDTQASPAPEGLRDQSIESVAREVPPEANEQAAAPQNQVLGGLTRQEEPAAKSKASNSAVANDLAATPPTAALRKSSDDRVAPIPEPNTEAFPEAEQNPLKITAEDPVSTFSIDVDTASYAVVRSSIGAGQLPPQQAVRIEEMINYFPYDYPAPDAGEAPFRPTVTVTPTPWNDGTELVHIAIQGREAATEDRPPLNLVFLIDTSGSMNQPNKLPLLKQSLMLMLPRLTEQDQVAIVTYAGSAGQVLAPTPATQRLTILGALNNLRAGGSTAGQAGLQQAYAVAAGMAEEGEVTRVILATDGDFNVGLSDPEKLKEFIADKRDSGTYLSVMGFGRGNLDDATMQALAQNGNGQASYIDTLSEAQKVLVDQFSGALFPIANDVKIQVEFNPATVAEYRLIGYETRALKREDFNNDKVDAGDIGAGHSVTAIYEITPAGSPARLSDPLRYGTTEPAAEITTELGYLKLRYKEPGQSVSQLIATPILPGMGEATNDMRFATAIAGFGELLKGSDFTSDWAFSDAIALAQAGQGDDPFGYRAEAIRLMRLADSLSR